VGVITKVWKHETADKLYCEEIDVGEAEPRQIASGLVPYYTEEQVRRGVLVHGASCMIEMVGGCVFERYHNSCK
jgi:hypothetical protein